ncbi:hypothetical protein GXW82_35850 [Streptacidiphilus sp. 4-A2]|nr:hypothetical protein [Streptacidiphilus sp. 4-A2]
MVGDDASKAYPDPPDSQFGIGADYSGASYAAGQPFVDGTAQVAPRHPINIYYNASTEAQEVDEYKHLYEPPSMGGQCVASSTTLRDCPGDLRRRLNSVVSGMMQNMLGNDPRPSYVHQTNIMGQPPAGPATAAPRRPPRTPPGRPALLGAEPAAGRIRGLLQLADALSAAHAGCDRRGAGRPDRLELRRVRRYGLRLGDRRRGDRRQLRLRRGPGAGHRPTGTTVDGAAFGQAYGGTLSAWTQVAGSGSTTLQQNTAPAVTSAATAAATAGTAFSATVTTTAPRLPRSRRPGRCPPGSASPTTVTAPRPWPVPRPRAVAAATRSPSPRPTPPARPSRRSP